MRPWQQDGGSRGRYQEPETTDRIHAERIRHFGQVVLLDDGKATAQTLERRPRKVAIDHRDVAGLSLGAIVEFEIKRDDGTGQLCARFTTVANNEDHFKSSRPRGGRRAA